MKLNLHTIPARQFYLLLGGILLLVAVGFASAVTLPQYKRVQGAQKAFSVTAQPASDSATLSGQLLQLDADIVALTKQLHGDRATAPAREIEAFVVDRLQTNAWQHDVALQSIVPRAGDNIEQFEELVFDLSLTGRYEDIYGWLRQLGDDLGFVVIKQLRITAVDSQQSEPELRADVTLASYRRVTG